MREIVISVKLAKILNDRDMQQKELVTLLDEYRKKRSEITGDPFKKTRPAAISEMYNNQRKSLNKELIEDILTVLKIENPNEFFEFTWQLAGQGELPFEWPTVEDNEEEDDR